VKKIIPFTFLLLLTLSACLFDKSEIPPLSFCDSAAVTYSGTIKPIVDAHCAIPGCHQTGFQYGDYTTYAGLKIKVDNGTFETQVLINQTMPSGGPPLPDSLQQLIRCWLDAGAPNN